jgi:hypothetical protein
MPERARVTSVEAIESFRTQLVLYLGKARPALEEVGGDLVRMRLWLQNEQRLHWEGEARRRKRALEEAQQAVFSAKLSRLREVNVAEQTALHKAKRAYDEAEAKLRIIKQWDRAFDNRTEPLARQLEKLQTILSNDMVKAVAYLGQTVETLGAYAGMTAPSAVTNPVPPDDSTAGAGTTGAAKQAPREDHSLS